MTILSQEKLFAEIKTDLKNPSVVSHLRYEQAPNASFEPSENVTSEGLPISGLTHLSKNTSSTLNIDVKKFIISPLSGSLMFSFHSYPFFHNFFSKILAIMVNGESKPNESYMLLTLDKTILLVIHSGIFP